MSSLRAIGVLAFLPFLATACGGKGGDPATVVPPPAPNKALDPRPEPLSDAEVQHFLVRVAFGSTRFRLVELPAEGLAHYLDEALTFVEGTPVERAALLEFADPAKPKRDELVRWWLHLMTRTTNPLQEVLALFWHNHFATSQLKLDTTALHLYRDHVQLLRRQGNGNFRKLLYAIAEDPAMLIWLDGVTSTKTGPNENFARELWELFTLGRNNGYTQQDIQEAARAFTGYRLDVDPVSGRAIVVYDESRADLGVKTIFGVSGAFGYRDVIDLTLARRPVAEYISRKLFAYFCHDDPPDAAIAQMAALLRANDYELAPLLKVLLRSEAFFAEAARMSHVKSPVEYAVGFIRTTSMSVPLNVLDDALAAMGQRLTQPPDVSGWRGDPAWLTMQSMIERSNFINKVISARTFQSPYETAFITPPRGGRTAAVVVDHLLSLLRVVPTDAERKHYVDYLDTGTGVHWATLEVITWADVFDWNSDFEERVRGLLFLLSQHSSYHLR